MSSNVLILIGSLGGAVVGAAAGFLGAWLKERYEDKRRKRELVIKAAIVDWEKHFEAIRGTNMKLMPLDSYIMHYALIMESIFNEDVDPKSIKERLKKSAEVMETYKDYDGQ